MRKRIIIGGGLIVVVVAIWLLFDYYHYSPPAMSAEEIRVQAEKELQEEVPKLLQGQRYDPYRKELRSLEVLDVRELNQKTYLVFKLDYDMMIPEQELPYNQNSQGYILGLRQVGKSLGGLDLKKGMEFTESYTGANPVSCGHDPSGIFYGFCKDPAVSKVLLNLDQKQSIEAEVNNRVILAEVPPETMKIDPKFYNSAGEEMELSYGMRIAFLSEDEKVWEQYEKTSINWWNISAEDLAYLPANMLDALWIFPDQQQAALEEKNLADLKRLLEDGVPLIFVGMKDMEEIAGAFEVNPAESSEQKDNKDSIEAVYVESDKEGAAEAGFIMLNDSPISPLLAKSMALKYKLEILEPSMESSPGAKDGEDSVSNQNSVPGEEFVINSTTARSTTERRIIGK